MPDNPHPHRRFTPPSPPVIPGYEILDFVDGGGQGHVYRARHLLLGRTVALKILKPAGDGDVQQHLARFHREGRLSARLDHPNIVRIYDYSEDNGQLFFSMEFLEGGSLKDRLRDVGRLAPEDAARLLATLADAVAHAHDRDVLHRDLKPGNVLFARDGTPKLTDFGLAKRLTEDATELTRTQMIMGTAAYMAPEQAAGKSKQATRATDIYSLGAVLYATLVGRPPFVSDDWLEVLFQVRTMPAVPPSSLRPEVPARLDHICLKCLEKEPARRYATAAELAADLGRFLVGEPTELRTPVTHGAPASEDSLLPVTPGTFPPVGTSTVPPIPISDRDIRAGWCPPGYVILGEVGRGGMGVVYRARQKSLNRVVALKTILYASDDGKTRDRFMRMEAQGMARLNHPQIVQVYDFGEHEGTAFFAMEYVEGGSLADNLRGGPLPPRVAAELLLSIAEAVAVVHDRGLVHRDLKPGNILLSPESKMPGHGRPPSRASQEFGLPKITDFGLALLVGNRHDPRGGQEDSIWSRDDARLTQSGVILGTPTYMPPEQAGQAHRVMPWSDVWSLGVILYEVLTGRRPFEGQGIVELLKQLTAAEPVPPSRLQPYVPRVLEAICLKCLAKEPTRRYGDGQGLADDLQRFLEKRSTRARPLPFWRRLFPGEY